MGSGRKMTINKFSHLSQDHYDDLKKSGLSDDAFLDAIKSVSPADMKKIFGYETCAKSAYEIPYPETDYSRYKIFYDESNKINPKTGKPRPKYLQRKGSGNHLYIPPRVKSILGDPSIPLYIAEGEKKALKACQENLYCIGLSGLWNWSSRNKINPSDPWDWGIGDKDKKLIQDFDLINFTGRTVYIVPDSDWLEPNKHGHEKNLKQAVWELAKKLQERGAIVKIVQLPKE